MRVRSGTENQQPISTKCELKVTAENSSHQSPESLRKQAQLAEVRARALESENKQLRSERAKAVLAAAHAERAARENPPPAAEEPKQRLDSLANGMKVAEEALRTAEREREAAIRAVEEALRKEYSQRVEAIRLSHAAQLTALSQEAEMRARQVVKQEIDLLIDELKDTEEALRVAEEERDAALRIVAAATDFPARMEAMRQSHAAELEAQAQQAKKRFAEELMTTLSTAHAAWKQDTEQQLQRARKAAQKDLVRAKAAWRRRSTVAFWKVARIWQARERKRLAVARQTWAERQRAALDACDRRWRCRFDRLKKRARRHTWQLAMWRGIKQRIVAFAKLHAGPGRFGVRPPEFKQPAAGHAGVHAGFVAAILVFVAVQFSPTERFPSEEGESMSFAAAAQTMPEGQLAKLPDDQARDDRSEARDAAKVRQKPSAQWNEKPATGQIGEGLRRTQRLENTREMNPPDGNRANGTSTPPSVAPAKQAVVSPGKGPGEQVVEGELRQRLQEKIRRLRVELSPQ